MVQKIKRYRFLFEELVKRDFTRKYKRTTLGVIWSALSPLMTLGVMALVFTQFFGRSTPHYVVYLFCGNIVFGFFRESTSAGMTVLWDNAGIFSKVNVPKYMFLFSKNVSTLLTFGINIVILFVFVLVDGLAFTWKYFLLLYPVLFLSILNLGMGFILSALFLRFRDLQYLYGVFTNLLMYVSAIFYSVDSYPEEIQKLFLINPVYDCIKYFRTIIIDDAIPSLELHVIIFAYAIIAFGIGALVYKTQNYKFLYYI
ncbi:MAG: ABC transporter permease [Oscillospiraceae bacterium]|nr:ABC transporter permease [Oscillospiraceae bacterium]